MSAIADCVAFGQEKNTESERKCVVGYSLMVIGKTRSKDRAKRYHNFRQFRHFDPMVSRRGRRVHREGRGTRIYTDFDGFFTTQSTEFSEKGKDLSLAERAKIAENNQSNSGPAALRRARARIDAGLHGLK